MFTCSIISFSIGNLLGDGCCKRIGVRGSILVVAGLMGIGLIAAASAKQAWALILYYGWIWGAAVGLGYNVLLGYAAYLVPNRAGTISGALLMLYGFGSLITGGLVTFIMGHIGWRCAFVCIGVNLIALFFVLLVEVLARFQMLPLEQAVVIPLLRLILQFVRVSFGCVTSGVSHY